MRAVKLSEMSAPLRGELVGDDVSFAAVSTDSRQIDAGDLFVALAGEKFDGHDFLDEVARSGAGSALVSRHCDTALPQLVVADTQQSLGELAKLNRDQFSGVLVGITGSCGKTTAKNFLAAIFAEAGPTLSTAGNFNNEIGMPLTLLRLQPEHEFAVIEMGAAGAGHIAYLCGISQPDVAVLLNAMLAHLDGFGSVDGVAHAKGEIFQSLGEKQTAVINADSEYAALWREMAAGATQLEFGLGDSAAVTATAIEDLPVGCRFQLHTPAGAAPVALQIPGRHNVYNALAAAAAALAAGVMLEQVVAGLQKVAAGSGRLSRLVGIGGAQLIDDSYNANPGSVRAAIDVLAVSSGKRWLVLGAMAELGVDSESLHAEIGEYASARGIERLWACGDETAATVDAFAEGGRHFSNSDQLVAAISEVLGEGDVVLVKGSRSAAMDRVVAALAVATGEGS